MLSINTNLSSIITQNSMRQSTNKLNEAIERMTTGYKINHAKDNAANYFIATSWDTKLSSYDVAMDNAGTGLDMIETASSNLELVNSHLVRLRDLAEQASNGTYGKQSLNALQSEAESRMKEITRIMNNAEFNGKKLFERQGGIAGMPKKTDGEFISKVERLSEEEAIAEGYTIIKTADELQAMNDDLDGKYILMNNIDLEGYDWEMIGSNWDNRFTGELNGNGFEIQNLFLDITNPDPYNIDMPVGLFSWLDGTVKNLGITNADVTSHDANAGVLAGCLDGQTDINNCYVTGSVFADNDAGGIVGYGCGNIGNSWANVDVYSGDEGAGGIAGNFESGSMLNCYAEGSVKGDARCTGGLAGWSECGFINIENSYSLCSIERNNYCGGILGSYLPPDSFINNCYWVGDDSVDVVGYIEPDPAWNGTITDAGCVTIDELLGTGNVDFFVGISSDSSSIINLDFGMEIRGLNFNLTDSDSARSCLSKIDNLLLKIGDKQVEFGAGQARLESAIDSIETTMTNLVSSLSTVRDADIAEVSSQYIQQQILQQASATLMATANQSPAIALQLI